METAPLLVAEDAALHFFFADMTGDGLPALVRIDRGRVEYWPHLGHGRFGERVVMEGAPTFDHEGTFDPRRIRLTDIDGSGTADLLYLGRGEVRFWTNASGNRFVEEQRREVPYIDDLAAVQVLDLLADGTPVPRLVVGASRRRRHAGPLPPPHGRRQAPAAPGRRRRHGPRGPPHLRDLGRALPP